METNQGQILNDKKKGESDLTFSPTVKEKTEGQLTYYCLLSTAASGKTLGLSLSQSRETLMAGRGHSPMISKHRLLLSRTRLHITPRKDTEETRSDITHRRHQTAQKDRSEHGRTVV